MSFSGIQKEAQWIAADFKPRATRQPRESFEKQADLLWLRRSILDPLWRSELVQRGQERHHYLTGLVVRVATDLLGFPHKSRKQMSTGMERRRAP